VIYGLCDSESGLIDKNDNQEEVSVVSTLSNSEAIITQVGSDIYAEGARMYRSTNRNTGT
jgi:hypothetical protein